MGFPVRAIPGTVDPAIVNKLVLLHIPFIVALDLVAILLLGRLALPKPALSPLPPPALKEVAG